MILTDFDGTTKLCIYKPDRDLEQQQRNINQKVIDNNMITICGTTGCLEEGTLIQTAKGLKKIEDIQEGEIIKAYDFNTERTELKRAILIKTGMQEVYELKLGNFGVINATADHKFFVKQQKGIVVEKKLSELKPNDKIVITSNLNRCLICNRLFKNHFTIRNTCSNKCYHKLLSKVLNYRNHQMKGVSLSAERRKIITDGMYAYWQKHPKNKRKLSIKLKRCYEDEKLRRKVGLAVQKAYKENPDINIRQGLASKGKNNPMYEKQTDKYLYFAKSIGHSVRSKWEEQFCQLLQKHNIKYTYEPKTFELEQGYTYTPDFKIKNTYVEIKGQLFELQKKKMLWFIQQYHKPFLIIGGWQCLKMTKNFPCKKIRFEKLTVEELLHEIH